MKKLFIILAAVTMVFVSCKKENNPNIAEQIVGKWLYIECDGKPAETEESSITNFVMEGSTLKAYTSISMKQYGLWAYNYPTEVLIDGNKLTLTMKKDNVTTVEEFTNITVCGDSLRYTSMYTVLHDSDTIDVSGPDQLYCVKVHDDYSQSIIGRWEGTITSDEPGFVPQPFCEKYLTDGTNIEYTLIDGEWVPVETEYAEYFVDGNLMCTRWQYPGEQEERENCIIVSCTNDELIAKEVVLRNGNLYTETSTLTKVND